VKTRKSGFWTRHEVSDFGTTHQSTWLRLPAVQATQHRYQRFVQYFLPKGTKFSRTSVMNVCRSLHLAFKGMETEEIYDILMEQLLRAARKYDPFYSDKVGKVVEVINRKRRKKIPYAYGRPPLSFVLGEKFTIGAPGKDEEIIGELNSYLDFDGTRFVRVLCRHGFLEAAPDQSDGVRYYRRTAAWPPPAKYLAAGQIGFAYYLQMWFRYYLQQYIESAMSELEAREGTYSLDFHRHVQDRGDDGVCVNPLSAPVDKSGKWWTSQENTAGEQSARLGGCDLSEMNLDWVAHTEDPIFADLSREDRLLLYLVFARNYKWAQIADALQISTPGMTERELERRLPPPAVG